MNKAIKIIVIIFIFICVQLELMSVVAKSAHHKPVNGNKDDTCVAVHDRCNLGMGGALQLIGGGVNAFGNCCPGMQCYLGVGDLVDAGLISLVLGNVGRCSENTIWGTGTRTRISDSQPECRLPTGALCKLRYGDCCMKGSCELNLDFGVYACRDPIATDNAWGLKK